VVYPVPDPDPPGSETIGLKDLDPDLASDLDLAPDPPLSFPDFEISF